MADSDNRKEQRVPDDRILTSEDIPGPDDEDIEIPDDDDLTEPVIKNEPTEAQLNEKRKEKRRRTVLRIFVVLAAVSVAAGVTLYFVHRHYAAYYATHFYKGTMINGTDVSYRTVDVVKQRIKDDVARYSLVIGEKNDKEEILRSEDVGWEYVDDGAVEKLMEQQDAEHWYRHFRDGQEYRLNAGISYDRDKAISSIRALDCLQEENVTNPKNAQLKLKTDGSYTVTKEVEGNRLDPEKTEQVILEALDASERRVDLTEPDCYLHPDVHSDDEALCRRRDQWNHLLKIHLTYQFGDNYEDIDRDMLLTHITDDGQNVTLTTDWVRDLVYEWAARYDTFGIDFPFHTSDGEDIVVPGGGDYGWCIDLEDTIDEILSAIDNAESGVRQVVWLYEAKGWDNDGLTGTYVEVSLDKQKLWCYRDYELVMETDVVTGRPTPDRETEPGVYAIDAKKSPATLGTMDVQGYSSPVSWWCPFNGGQGLHDAPWRDAFGGSIYLTNGSHGCVNIPVDRMQVIYDTVETGTPVVVY